MISSENLQPLRYLLLLSVPLLYVLAAFLANWRVARFSTALALGIAAVSLLLLTRSGALIGNSLRADATGCIVLMLVAFIGWVITRYSQTYMAGDARQTRYVRWLMATLSAVAVVVVTNNLAVLALAWLATSLALHQLLTFFNHRPAAFIAAHKKFLASRLGDGCLFTAVVLIATPSGSLQIDQIIAHANALPTYPMALKIAVFLIAICAIVKCAQLPVHGWLIQVMEAPTPVSALLHAGIVNLGGFLLIRLSPLMDEVSGAQTLLVVMGSVTAVVASLVMMTRISVKVMLAWSTCAQMGFMLMQCGLGFYDLALLHLVAHSLYKAYAFLAAGGAVEQARLKSMMATQAVSFSALAMSAIAGLFIVALAGLAWSKVFAVSHPTELWLMAMIVALAIAPLLSTQTLRVGRLWSIGLVLIAFGSAFTIAIAYFGLHHVFGQFVDGSVRSSENRNSNSFNLIWVTLCFVLLFALQCLIRARPHGLVASRLYPWFYSGLYLDEWFTRLTFRIWPARLTTQTGASK